uniref:Carbohydrate kinase PfkB domain-containing protein n=1 Tax=Kalanchoe fedtschenkoi TaxID=63787 RepID=A0A7N0SYH4_KALFE
MPYALPCHQRKCFHLLLKWQVQTVKPWERVVVFHTSQTHVFHVIYISRLHWENMDSMSILLIALRGAKILYVGCGLVGLDFVAAVDAYPKPDEKIRTTSLKVQGGCNAGNAMTCAARLGLNARLISNVANDAHGRLILEELKADGVDISFFHVSEEGNSAFSYVLADSQTKTRTCITTLGHPPISADDRFKRKLASALDGAEFVYIEGGSHEAALVTAQEAAVKNIPVLVDAERKGEGLEDQLQLATYVVCSAEFPQEWTGAPSVSNALVAMLVAFPRLKFAMVTLGENGCVMLERVTDEIPQTDEVDVEQLLESLKRNIDESLVIPTCASSPVANVSANGIGTVSGRLLLGTAEKIPPSELVDTTGAGDAFIGAVLYALCEGMAAEKMLPFASQVAAINCRALGARASLPRITDPRLACFLGQ